MFFQEGHYYSPVVNVDEVKVRENEIWQRDPPTSLPGIDLNENAQLALIKSFTKFYPEIPFPDNKNEKHRYYFKNDLFSYSDAIFLYSMIRHYSPTRIIEVGSGFSSAAMLDTLQILDRSQTKLTFIEPYAERLHSLLTDNDRQKVNIIEKRLQTVDSTYFEQLSENDILFIDSTHIAKTGSDVNYLLFEILPSLKKGVLIHFHDIFYPFEYPKDWVLSGRSWNEDYFLRSFLMYNNSFEIILFSHFIHMKHGDCLSQMPDCYKNSGGSFWIRKVV
ncbi:MAG: class I SAM-dependent methyltransferase [Bacteroidota bacterium]